ncbi:hypothetical protein RA27_22860 [Ruegeria sp. ANG-R]|uniref:hypothetical protein n=1 Tax=Ruegeria sp. ANG-R TaxID=1577903 RepID=UPI00057EBFE1|nr:hypothetical protein [Ruegeria sp. ANG-R]KIC35396.1 hypothetical protein RA27_22860 [Ruegeria sp. ANG-R]
MKKSIAVVFLAVLSACANDQPPTTSFEGKEVPLPVNFHSSVAYGGATGGGLAFFVNHGFNTPISCDYKFGQQTGQFTTPETVIFNHTDEKRILELDCSFDGEIGGKRYAGSQMWAIETDFDREGGGTSVGSFGDRRYVRFPSNPLGRQLKAALIDSKGVQMLPPTVSIGLRVLPVDE